MSLFKRVFGGRWKRPQRPIDEMSVREVFEFIKGTAEDAASKDSIAAFRRLTNLALFEHGIPDEERNAALEVAKSLHTDIQAGLANDPVALEAFEEAADFHLSNARHSGYGSLQWIMEEQAVSAAEVIEFISRPERAELLPAYLEMMEPEVITKIRAALLSALARSRTTDGEDTLSTVARLADLNDGAMTMLLSGSELSALRRAPADSETAFAVLRKIGVDLN